MNSIRGYDAWKLRSPYDDEPPDPDWGECDGCHTEAVLTYDSTRAASFCDDCAANLARFDEGEAEYCEACDGPGPLSWYPGAGWASHWLCAVCINDRESREGAA